MNCAASGAAGLLSRTSGFVQDHLERGVQHGREIGVRGIHAQGNLPHHVAGGGRSVGAGRTGVVASVRLPDLPVAVFVAPSAAV